MSASTSGVTKACDAVAEGKVTRAAYHTYDVVGRGDTYQVILRETDTGRLPTCNCRAGREGQDCWHGLAALWQDTRASAREQAWAEAISAMRCLFEIVEAEDAPDGSDGDEAVRTALLEALDRFDDAHNIETANAENED